MSHDRTGWSYDNVEWYMTDWLCDILIYLYVPISSGKCHDTTSKQLMITSLKISIYLPQSVVHNICSLSNVITQPSK